MNKRATGIAICAVAAAAATFVVWFAGFDLRWSIAAVLVVGPVVAVIATRTFDEPPPWDPPTPTTLRGTRLVAVLMVQSLGACNRLADPAILRRVRAWFTPERDDRLARLTLVRQVRALLVAELRDRGLTPSEPFDDAVALFGPDARLVLQPHDDHAVTSSAIARCLDAIERLAPTTPGTR